MSLVTMILDQMTAVSSSKLTEEQKELLLEAIDSNNWTEETQELMKQVNKEPNPYYDPNSQPLPSLDSLRKTSTNTKHTTTE